MQWEYKMVKLGNRIETDNINEIFNQYGTEGWELVNILTETSNDNSYNYATGSSLQRFSFGYFAVFKRLIK